MPFYTPLRYPGGKRRLVNYFKVLWRLNAFESRCYVEPYAGGAAVALALLLDDYAERVWINDLDPSIYAFWSCVKEEAEVLCSRIRSASITMAEWERQKAVQDGSDPEPIDLAFSTFFLNRCNRSGIVRGGVIGGRDQKGVWGIDSRFNKVELAARIERIAEEASRIDVSCMDAAALLGRLSEEGGVVALYLDPPYFRKRARLYRDDYDLAGHRALAAALGKCKAPWILSYNKRTELRRLYKRYRGIAYDLHYAAGHRRYDGSEMMFFADDVVVPDLESPVRVSRRAACAVGVCI